MKKIGDGGILSIERIGGVVFFSFLLKRMKMILMIFLLLLIFIIVIFILKWFEIGVVVICL